MEQDYFIPDHFDEYNGNPNDVEKGVIGATYWQQMVEKSYSESEDVLEARCARRCLTTNIDKCNFYAIVNSHCQLGFLNTGYGRGSGTFTDSTVIRWRNEIGKNIDCNN